MLLHENSWDFKDVRRTGCEPDEKNGHRIALQAMMENISSGIWLESGKWPEHLGNISYVQSHIIIKKNIK